MTHPDFKTGMPDSDPAPHPDADTPAGSCHRPTYAVIHLSHIQANLKAVQARVGAACKVWAVVKANAYGHGMIPVAHACLQADAHGLAVATPDEAVELRERFPTPPILVMGPTFPADAEALVHHRIEVAVGDPDVARSLSAEATRQNAPTRVHLKVDTGMGRFGFPATQIEQVAAGLARCPGLRWRGIFTHFSVSDSPAPGDRDYTASQLNALKQAATVFLAHLPAGSERPWLHACNSGGILQHPPAFFDAVRPGVMLYGHLPDPACEATVPLRPGMTLKTRIVGLRTHPPGTALSYGRTYVCPRETRIGILPVGYGDGYNRLLSNQGEVVVAGRRAPIRGRVCMDQTLIDVTEIPGAGIGAEVVLFGGTPGPDGRPPLPVQEVARWLHTIPYEVTCQVGRRVPRIYEP